MSGEKESMKPQSSISNYECALVETVEEREAVFALRMQVFVEEQKVPVEEELDAYDITASHFLVRELHSTAGKLPAIIGTARLIDKGEGTGKIGRVAIGQQYRGKGAGALLMRFVERIAMQRGFKRLILEAQCYAIPFYEKLDYIAEGDIFFDANIEHRLMTKSLDQSSYESTQG